MVQTANSRYALSIENLTVQFGGLLALQDVDIVVPPGSRYGILGPNGAGKTTLFNVISGFVKPTKGRVFLHDADISKKPPHKRVQYGLARTFQITTLFAELSVLENILMAALVQAGTSQVFWKPVHNDKVAVSIAESQLHDLGLMHLAGKAVNELAYGEQRLLEIAVALASNPSVLLLDEPTAGLSTAEIKAVVRLVTNLPKDLTIIMIEHDLDVIFDVSEYLSVLHGGQAIAHGPADEIRHDERVKEVYLGES
ncbi:MAG: ABC transporter ATP-binding protein [Anaerolineaceae bacterium]|nr:ABC transporter ATP-binding protein [Anaerolineaceae bacterium]